VQHDDLGTSPGHRPASRSRYNPHVTDELVEALSRPTAYPHRPADVEVRETHISWVFLAGERAYKLKKPVKLDFVDYGTPERRWQMCEAEVRLNRRLAPDIYLGTRGVALLKGGAELTEADDPRAVDFLVEMRRYDERRTLAARLERGKLTNVQLRDVATTLARFHREARSVPAGEPAALAAERRFERNAHELIGLLEQRPEIDHALALERFAHAFIAGHAQTFETRAASGAIREGHGDLRADHVLIDGAVEIVDCVEFDLEFRELDVADELAFLLLDLAMRGGERYGPELVAAYRGAGGDPGDVALLAFYAVYRALVRAKVARVRCAQAPPGSAEHAHHSARARELMSLAERFAWRARTPLVIAVCGVAGSGKSHLATALAVRSGLPHLSSDVTRKRLAGVATDRRAPEAAYSAEWNARTYAELARLTTVALAERGGAIVDATFRHPADRQTFAAAFDSRSPMLFVECIAPPSVLAARGARRERGSERISDAGAAIIMRERLSWAPLDEVPAEAHVVLRTDRPIAQIVDDLLSVLDHRLEELARARVS
jgi:uncharacterized protein